MLAVPIAVDAGSTILVRGRQPASGAPPALIRLMELEACPGSPALLLEGQVGIIDLTPTLLDLFGLASKVKLQGRSLAPALDGTQMTPIPIVSEIDDASRKISLRFGSGKLIHSTSTEDLPMPDTDEWELFDMTADPGEKGDLASSNDAPITPRVAELERLKALGYLGG